MTREQRISTQWEELLSHRDAEVREIVTEAFRDQILRSTFPFTSHQDVRFTTVFPFPYEWGLPLIRKDGGVHQVWLDGCLVFEGDLDGAVRLASATAAKMIEVCPQVDGGDMAVVVRGR